jgi:hypothetical protein
LLVEVEEQRQLGAWAQEERQQPVPVLPVLFVGEVGQEHVW